MRKIVLLLVCLVLFLFYSAYSDCPEVDSITPGQVLEGFKNYFNSTTKQEDIKDSVQESSVPEESTQEGLEQEGLDQENRDGLIVGETLTSAKKESEVGNEGEEAADNITDEAPRKFLDLTLPQLVDEVMDLNIFKYEYKSILPNLFTPVKIRVEEEEDRTSFGGRVLMDENFNQMEVDEFRIEDLRGSIEGAELTFEVKTN